MNGLELSKGYFEKFGRPMLEEQFKEVLDLLAVGFTGRGSEHYGFDDEVSRDHDFEPGFCIFIPGEDVLDRKNAFLLERAYAKLPKEYHGVSRGMMSPVGGNRNGVIRTADFYENAVGSPDGKLTLEQWLKIPDYALAESTNGEIYFDNYGEFSGIREYLKNMPRDILLKRVAGNLLIMAQSGQYNYVRCLKHGEPEAAQFACHDFVDSAMKVAFLLNGEYMPYYKWSFRALRQIEGMGDMAEHLSFILTGDNGDSHMAELKYDIIESVATEIIDMLIRQDITKAICGDLEKHAYSVNDFIQDSQLRNMNILAGIN